MTWSQFNWVDVIWAVWLLVGLLQGLRRGLSGELARVISAGLALWAAWRFYEPLATRLDAHTDLSPLATAGLAFVGLTVAGLLVMHLIRLLLHHVLQFTFRGKIERLGGMLAGGLRAGLFAAALIFALGFVAQEDVRRHVVTESFIGTHLQRWASPVWEELRAEFPQLLPDWQADEGAAADEQDEAAWQTPRPIQQR